MITKEQAKEILTMADKFAAFVAANEMMFQNDGHVPKKHADNEDNAWQKLKSYVEGLTEE